MSLRSLSCNCFAILLVIACISGNIFSQSQCYIRTEESFSLSSQPRSSEFTHTQKYYDRIAWFDMGKTQLSDDLCTKIYLEPGQKSESLVINTLHFNLPSNAIITGVDARLFGRKEGDGKVKDLKIQLINAVGKKVGLDKANKSLKGKPWNQGPSLYDYWSYGSERDNWGYNWTSEEINSSEFGLSIELINRSSDNVLVLLDQLVVTVYYEAAIDLCSDDYYISLFAFEEPTVVEYNWEVPSALNYEVVEHLPSMINILADGSDYGDYNICLTKIYNSGSEEQCCNAFTYRNCDKSSIGDFVWHDLNGNGLQDSGEPGIDNQRVYLYNESMQFIAQVITDQGFYTFDNLDPGSYFLKIKIDNLDITTSNNSNDDLNSDFFEFLEEKMSKLITLAPGQHFKNIDFGFANRGSIAGLTWLDKNANGFFESEDLVLGNVIVNLLDENAKVLKTTISDQNGTYTFSDLLPGNYQLNFQNSPEYFASDLGMENNINANFYTELFELEMSKIQYRNAAFYRRASISGNVWLDIDEDNIKETEDYALEDIPVVLKDCQDNIISESVTDIDGNYSFHDLKPGSYTTCIDNNRQGIYIPKAIECSSCNSILEYESLEEIDYIFNLDNSYSIKLYVYQDLDNSNSYEGNEVVFTDWNISLFDCNGVELTTSSTDHTGLAMFEFLDEGEYYIELDYDEDFTLSSASEFKFNSQKIVSDCFLLNDHQELHLGLVRFPKIGDFVWFDKNNNGIQDGGEMGLEAIRFQLYNDSDELIAETQSDLNGFYGFDRIPTGRYYMVIPTLEDLFELTTVNSTDDEFNSDFTEKNGIFRSNTIGLEFFDELFDIDLGLIAKPTTAGNSISGNIWRDSNGDLEQVSEENLSSIQVSLFDCDDNLIDITTTDTNGYYSFSDLPLGNYYILVDQQDGFFIYLTEGSGSTGSGKSECFNIDGEDIEIEAAYIPMSTIGDLVWLDENANGKQDDNEIGISGIDMILFNEQEDVIAITSTDQNGYYSFSEVLPGIYFLEIINASDDYMPTLQSIGNDLEDSELRLEQGRYMSELIEIVDGVAREDIDLGLNFHQSIIGGTVFVDDNMDGTRSGVEKGMKDIGIRLYNSNDELLQSTVTDKDGVYRFYNVFSGEYYLMFDLPTYYIFSPIHIGGDDLFDSDVMEANGKTNLLLISGNKIYEGINAGLIRSNACIAGTYWIDMNEDGIMDKDPSGFNEGNETNNKNKTSEPLVSGAMVNLYNEQGDIVSSDVTDAFGQYMLCDIESGFHYLRFELLSGFEFTKPNETSDELLDSDVVTADGSTEVFEIVGGEVINGLNAGIHIDNTVPNSKSGEGQLDNLATGKFNEEGVFVVEASKSFENSLHEFSDYNPNEKVTGLSAQQSDAVTDIRYLSTTNSERWSYVFPNPVVGDELNLVIDTVEDIKSLNYRIFDMSGSQMITYGSQDTFKKGKHQFNIPILNFSEGVYTLQLRINERTENHRIVIFSR